MVDNTNTTNRAAKVRRLAEEKIASLLEAAASTQDTNTKVLLHELQVNQVELEMQNEELHRAMEELREHKDHLEKLIKKTPAGYFRIDREGRFLEVNNAWLRMYGYDSPDEIIGKHFSMIQVESESGSALEHLAELEKGVSIPIGEFSSRRKDGSVGHHIFYAHPVVHVGEIVGVEWFIIDISERRQIEDVQSYLLKISSLHDGEDFFESLARYLAEILGMDYVCIDRLQGDCLSAKTLAVYHDGRFEDNVEYTLKDTPCGDVVGKEVCVFPRDVRRLFPRDEALQDLQAESYVGTTLWSFDMKPIGLIAVIGRKELISSHFAETVLKLVAIRAAGELERRQAEADKLMLQKQFQQAQKLESLGVLSGGIAHDFNNILAVIIGHCGLAKLRPASAMENLRQIELAAEHAAMLCQQMLAYAGESESIMVQVNLGKLVDDTLSMLKSTLPQNVVLKVDHSAPIPDTLGDASQLRQVVMNLVINAAEAIGEKQGEVFVTLNNKTITADQAIKDHMGDTIKPGPYICMEITDTGCGMDEETAQRIFEPFYSTKFAGRGLGMSAVLGIIRSHGGALQLTSQPGKGTTFKVCLPVHVSELRADESAGQTHQAAAWRGSGTILIAEDEPQIREIARLMLEESGFTVIEATNGKEALALYRSNSAEIALVLTDIGMPHMDGYELFRELKNLNPELPIIVSSGFGDADIAAHFEKNSLAGIVSKPYRFDQLQEVVRRAREGALAAHA